MNHLKLSIGQYSDKGCKAENQDFHGSMLVNEPLASSKGMAIAIADGISSSDVSHIASQTAIKSFFNDYYSTPDSWSVRSSANKVIQATNSWLYSQTRSGPSRYNKDKGYVCTFSALVLKSNIAHIFHVGDARVYQLDGKHLNQLTEDHRLRVSAEKSYLSRALGMNDRMEIDYQSASIDKGDIFILATDGVYEFMSDEFVVKTIDQHSDDLNSAAKMIVEHCLEKQSDDNLTVQIVRIDELPDREMSDLQQQAKALPFPPELRPRSSFEGYTIQREIYNSSRSHVYLALDEKSQQQVIIKTPSVTHKDDAKYLERFLMEEWVSRRIDNEHVLKSFKQDRKRNYLYLVSEYIEGQTLDQWIKDNPEPDLESVRNIIEQIAAGLRAFHRQEMLHQDLRPNNIIIDKNGIVKIIDFGSVMVAGVVENIGVEALDILGTMQYTAPEYFVGEMPGTWSDQFSLGVIAYQMLTGKLPYGLALARASNKIAQRRCQYQPIGETRRDIPMWIDETIRKMVHINPFKRYMALSEFIGDLRNPNPAYVNKHQAPLIERDPLLFWKGLSMVLMVIVVILSTLLIQS